MEKSGEGKGKKLEAQKHLKSIEIMGKREGENRKNRKEEGEKKEK